MKLIRFTHYYSTDEQKSKFYGVRTNADFEEVCLMCAYLELIRFYIPDPKYCYSDTLCEDEIMDLLVQFYHDAPVTIMETCTEPQDYDYEIDLFDNWNDFACKTYFRNQIDMFSVEQASIRMMKYFLPIMRSFDSNDIEKEDFIGKYQQACENGVVGDWETSLEDRNLNGIRYQTDMKIEYVNRG